MIRLFKVVQRKLFFPLVIFMAMPVHAVQVFDDVEGSVDLPMLERFPDSGIVRYQSEGNASYVMALGKIKRIDGAWRAEQEKTVSGQLTSLTYRAQDRQSARSVFSHFSKQLEALGVEELYGCTGLACGNSNKWANKIFMEKILYGPSPQQYYFAGRLNETYIALYAIKRGNKRVYVRIDSIAQSGEPFPAKPVADSLNGGATQLAPSYAQLEEDNFLVLDGFTFEADQIAQPLVEPMSAFMQTLADKLRINSLRLRIVVHSYEPVAVDVAIAQSTKQAASLADYLVEQGVDKEQLESFGVGPLSPQLPLQVQSDRPINMADQQNRVEMFLLAD